MKLEYPSPELDLTSEPQIPDAFTDYLKERNAGKMPKDALFTHCIREMFQRQWSILLDEELIHAMKNGLRIVCPDGKPRLFFPRVFTYSADYPEKYVMPLLPTSSYFVELPSDNCVLGLLQQGYAQMASVLVHDASSLNRIWANWGPQQMSSVLRSNATKMKGVGWSPLRGRTSLKAAML